MTDHTLAAVADGKDLLRATISIKMIIYSRQSILIFLFDRLLHRRRQRSKLHASDHRL